MAIDFLTIILLLYTLIFFQVNSRLLRHNSSSTIDDSLTYLWPLPSNFTSGDDTLSVDPDFKLLLSVGENGDSPIVRDAFERYKSIIFKHARAASFSGAGVPVFDLNSLRIVVSSDDEELQLGTDESYDLVVSREKFASIINGVTILANTIYGALRGLETFSQLCHFDYGTKTVQIDKAPWYIRDKPRFAYRGLLLDTSRHYYPVEVIKQIIESMSYAKLNVFHWHIIDEESFPLEVTTYPYLWKGAYTKWERYTVEDAHEIVKGEIALRQFPYLETRHLYWDVPKRKVRQLLWDGGVLIYSLTISTMFCFRKLVSFIVFLLALIGLCFAKARGINVMAEIDVPGHAESWGAGYPDLWPSPSCREPLDVSKNFSFDVLAGILADMRKIFPFELFHLGGDEVNTDCWNTTPRVKQWLQERNMTTKDAYQYFVIRAQEIAISKNWTPVNWEETFNTFASKLNPKTVVHNWLGAGVCTKAVAKGFRCIYSNQGFWYLDHLDVPWDEVYTADPIEEIRDPSQQDLVIGGEVCMWSEVADPSNVQQTIWPRAAAAAERLWSTKESSNSTSTALPRLHYFRCLLTRRGVQAAPVSNLYARRQPKGPGSCYDQ